MDADAVDDIFRTRKELLGEPLLSTLLEFLPKALDLCVTLASANKDIDHRSIQPALNDRAPLSGTPDYKILNGAGIAQPTSLLVKLADKALDGEQQLA